MFQSKTREHDYASSEAEVKACRLCLETDSALSSISKTNLIDPINLLTGIIVTTNDGLPQYICSCCKYLINKFMKFRERCHNAQSALSRVTLMKMEITTDLIRAIDRVSLNLTLSLGRADEIIDCLGKDYLEIVIPKQEPEYFSDPLKSCEIQAPDDKSILPKYEIDILDDDQSTVPKCDSNKLEIVIDKIHMNPDPLYLENTSNFNMAANYLRNDKQIASENAINFNEAIEEKNKRDEFEKSRTCGFTKCGLTVDEIVLIQNQDEKDYDDTWISDYESEEEEEVFPEVQISKKTNVNLKIDLSIQNKKILEKFFYQQFKIKNQLSQEKACQLERVRRVLEYNGYDFTKLYEEDELKICGRKKIITSDVYLWVSSEKKRIEFEEKFNTKVMVLSKEQQIEEFEARATSVKYNRKLFKCAICFTGFMEESVYVKHLRNHRQDFGKFECNICHYRYANTFRYRVHMLKHRSKFICKKCGYTTDCVTSAKFHHSVHEGFKFKCKYCPRIINARSTYFAHMKLRHASELVPCDVCGETFSGKNGLTNHMARTHEVVGQNSFWSKCSTCNVRFNNVKALTNHLSSWENEVCNPEMKSCIECGQNFDSDELLVEHAIVHEKTFQCKECDMLFAAEKSLIIHHQRTHLNLNKSPYKYRRIHAKTDRPKQKKQKPDRKRSSEAKERLKGICEYCGKTVANKYLMEEHINSHLGIKPYKCHLCNKAFGKKLILKMHTSVHTGERPFICELCGASFHYSGNLKRHKNAVHKGLKPFQCDICHKKFSCKSSVSLHVRTVHMKLPHPPRKKRTRPGAVKRLNVANIFATNFSNPVVVENIE